MFISAMRTFAPSSGRPCSDLTVPVMMVVCAIALEATTAQRSRPGSAHRVLGDKRNLGISVPHELRAVPPLPPGLVGTLHNALGVQERLADHTVPNDYVYTAAPTRV